MSRNNNIDDVDWESSYRDDYREEVTPIDYNIEGVDYLETTDEIDTGGGGNTQDVNQSSTSYQIHGVVQDSLGNPLIGAAIQNKNNLWKGTTTDYGGNFVFEADNANDLIAFSYLGFKTKEIYARNVGSVIVLEEDVEDLDTVWIDTTQDPIVTPTNPILPTETIEPTTKNNTLLYAGVGVGALLIGALISVAIAKKSNGMGNPAIKKTVKTIKI